MKKQKGFTLIELVMAILLIGILAAIAVPKFVDLTSHAQSAAMQGIVGALSAANANNAAACSAVGNVVTANVCVKMTKCSDVATLLLSPPLTLGTAGPAANNVYNLSADTTVSANGTSVTCTLQILKGGTTYSGTYNVTGAGY